MGVGVSQYINQYVFSREGLPSSTTPIQHDQQLGFARERKQREMPPFTLEELQAMNIRPESRDYCVHFKAAFDMCVEERFPFVRRCKMFEHAYFDCLYDMKITRMKEFERERRLNLREKRIARKRQGEELHDVHAGGEE